MKGMSKFLLIMIVPFIIVAMWDKYPIIKNAVHGALDPWLGALLNWNIMVGFIVTIVILTFFQSLAQKYLTNQEELKKLKAEQKTLQEEMKQYRDNPEKFMELQKKSFEFVPKTMDLTMNSVIYTTVPLILLYRWFGEYLHPVWGGWWILYYIIASIIFSTIFRKIMKIA